MPSSAPDSSNAPRHAFRILFAVLLPAALACATLTTGCSEEPADTSKPVVEPKLGDPDFDPHEGEETGAVAAFDVAGKGWYSMPFPSDMRRKSDGSIDLSGFPEPREGEFVDLLKTYLTLGKVLDGWGLQPTVYVKFDVALDQKQLPTAKETTNQDFMFLINVTPDSKHRGEQVPLRWRVSPDKRGQLLEANMLMVQPTWGTPLRPKSTYAFVLRRGVRDDNNKVLKRPVALAAIIDTATGASTEALDPKYEKLAKTFKPLTDAIADKTITVPPMDIAAASVMTTGDPVGPLRTLAKHVRSDTKREKAIGWKADPPKKNFRLIRGKYVAPNFQQGEPPYTSKGGGFVFDKDGKPVVQATELMDVAVAVPNDRSQEVGGKLPVVIYSHGTGGSYDGFSKGGKLNVAELLTKQGLAVIGINQPLHGVRSGKDLDKRVLQLATFNYLNPPSGRSVFRQGALDNVFLLEMLREGKLNIPAAAAPGNTDVQFDANRMMFMGHSQGGVVGVLLATVEPHFRAFMLSGAGGGLSLTAVMRKDIVNFPELIQNILGLDDGELSEFHPGISLIQLLVDITDPLSYGRDVFVREPGIRPPHVLMTEGLLDEASLAPTAEALAAAMGLAILKPAAHLSEAAVALKTPVLPLPVKNNLTFGEHAVTGLLVQYPKGDHFVIFGNEDAASMYADFLFSVASTGEAFVQ
jgi:pimeloyl-ACP methyl ester carboxylesterase